MGKILRVQRDGSAAPGNPFAGNLNADERVYAYGFARPSDFAFHPATGDLFSADATDSCEELNVVSPGGNYGWPDVGEFPFEDCTFGSQVKALYFLSRPNTEPGQFESYVGVSGMAFLAGDKYSALGNGLLVCEKETHNLRRLVISPDARQVTADDIAISECDGSVVVAADGTVYFSNGTEVRRLVQGEAPAPASASASPSP
jgi:glucose/arabinose dehydrogenase